MRTLWRNKQPFYYANYVGKEAIKDADNYFTGAYKITYTTPKKIYGNISPSRGLAQFDMFGSNGNYTKAIIMESIPEGFNEQTVLFIEKPVEYDDLGNLLYDYTITEIGKSFNSVSISIDKVASTYE